MHNLIRYYYKNKYKIWGVIIFIVLLLMIIQVVNRIVENSNNQASTVNNLNIGNSILNNKNTNTHITSNTSGVTGEIINNTSLEEASEIIENFISACNNRNIEEAYSYLSEDCKNEIYSDVNKFKTLYYDTIFGGNTKNASVENWLLNTYKVNITENIMQTGDANGIKTQDYITIVREDDGNKLNINSFVRKEEVNRVETIEDIEFTIINKKIYMDYEEYEIQVRNATGKDILLDSQQDVKSIFIQDNNETKYYSYSHELISSLLKINNGFSTHLTIKFSKSYSQERTTSYLIFSDVILNYNGNIDNEIDREQIKIAL